MVEFDPGMQAVRGVREFALQEPPEQLVRVAGEPDHLAAAFEVVDLDLPRA